MPEVPDLPALAAVIADFAAPVPSAFDDTELMDAQRTIADISRRVDAIAASIAGEIAHRSRRELGHSGLAQRLGARTPERLVQHLTGATGPATRTLVRVGAMLTPADASGAPLRATDDAAEAVPVPCPVWLTAVAAAVSAGTLSLAAADAIRAGLGDPDTDVSADDLIGAATALLALALSGSVTVEQLAIAARDARAELDVDAVTDREQRMRDRRYLHLIPQPDGMTRITGLLDPESAAHVVTAVDAATSPRRGGPRFVDPEAAASAEALLADPRTIEQITLDTVVDLIRIATLVDDGSVLGTRRPVVQLHVTDRDLRERRGLAGFDGQPDPVSIATAERHVCETGVTAIHFDGHGGVINIGRDQRTFTQRQRLALAARDGGCRFPDCDRPPSWTEAHHVLPWSRGGPTDLDNGILLCRHHHMMLHNNGWNIVREQADYLLIPPADLDPLQRAIPMPSKSRTLRRALAS